MYGDQLLLTGDCLCVCVDKYCEGRGVYVAGQQPPDEVASA